MMNNQVFGIFNKEKINVGKYLVPLLLIFTLSACNGGGGGGGTNTNIPNTDKVPLMPLNISLHDMNGNAMASVDVSKIGGHSWYKLTLTNPNKVPVTMSNFHVDGLWMTAQIPKDIPESSILYQSWVIRHNPGITSVTAAVKKPQDTKDLNNCLNVKSMEPGSSCSYTMLALNPHVFYEQTSYKYPFGYTIMQANLSRPSDNRVDVQQCTHKIPFGEPNAVGWYDCSNESKPGFNNQFIHYTTNSFHGSAPDDIIELFNKVSADGKSLYMCDDAIGGHGTKIPHGGGVCGRYALNYDQTSNTLSKGVLLNQFTLFGGPAISRYGSDGLFPYPDGHMAWFIAEYDGYKYQLINSNEPNHPWYKYCREGDYHCVPNLEYSDSNGAKMGLDGTFWWSPYNEVKAYPSDIYDETTNMFHITNVPFVFGVNADETIIARSSLDKNISGISCWRQKNLGDYKSYVPQPLLNYAFPEYLHDVKYDDSVGKNVYMVMAIPDLVDFNGKDIPAYNPLYADYKIHTENGLCEIEPEDYIWTYMGMTTQYGYDGGSQTPSGPRSAYVVPQSQIYLGK